MDCTSYIAKTKALIICTVTAQLISSAFVFADATFVFVDAKSRFFHDTAHLIVGTRNQKENLNNFIAIPREITVELMFS